jgi:hypothetical protein
LIADFKSAGFSYVADKTALDAIKPEQTNKLLGLFAYSNMNVALDKIDGRRGKEDWRQRQRGRRLWLPRPAYAGRDDNQGARRFI